MELSSPPSARRRKAGLVTKNAPGPNIRTEGVILFGYADYSSIDSTSATSLAASSPRYELLCRQPPTARPLLANDAIEKPVGLDLVADVILLEEVRHASVLALVANTPHPAWVHRPPFLSVGLFTTGDHPVDRAPVQMPPEVDAFEQRLGGNKPDRRRDLRQLVDSIEVATLFHGHAQPDVRVALAPVTRQVLQNPLRPLGENQPVEILAGANDLPYLRPPRISFPVEEVRHRAGEDAMSSALSAGSSVPCPGFAPVGVRGPHRPLERLMSRAAHDLPDVTVGAGGRDLVAAPPRVPGVMGPANFRVFHFRLSQ